LKIEVLKKKKKKKEERSEKTLFVAGGAVQVKYLK
jgi:hypothetical protein